MSATTVPIPRWVRGSAPGAGVATEGGAQLELLRAGQTDETLFLLPGLEGEPAELAPLVAAFSVPQEVVGVVPPKVGDADLGVPELAAAMLSAVRSRQPRGPTGSAATRSVPWSRTRWLSNARGGDALDVHTAAVLGRSAAIGPRMHRTSASSSTQ